jgi:heme O synthase-like polyprenyltransferase
MTMVALIACPGAIAFSGTTRLSSSLRQPSLGEGYRYHSSFIAKSSKLSAVEGDFDPDALSKSVAAVKAGSLQARLRAIYKFTRPHTIRGTILASVAGTIRALVDTPGALANAQWSVNLPRAVIGMVALLLGNAFIVGINQIFDEGIDKMNKPFLPVASGEMSRRFAWAFVLISGIVGPVIV